MQSQTDMNNTATAPVFGAAHEERSDSEHGLDETLCSLRTVEIRHIARVLQASNGNQRRAARILGITRWSLARRMRKYGITPVGELEITAGPR